MKAIAYFIKPSDFTSTELNILVYILYKIQKLNNHKTTFTISFLELTQYFSNLKESKFIAYEILKKLQFKMLYLKDIKLQGFFYQFNIYFNKEIHIEIKIHSSRKALIQKIIGNLTEEDFNNYLKLKAIKSKILFLFLNIYKEDGKCDVFKDDMLGFYDLMGDLASLKRTIPKLQEFYFYQDLQYVVYKKDNKSYQGIEIMWNKIEK